MNSALLKQAKWEQQKAQDLILRGNWEPPQPPLWKLQRLVSNIQHRGALLKASVQMGQVSHQRLSHQQATLINSNLSSAGKPHPSVSGWMCVTACYCSAVDTRDGSIPNNCSCSSTEGKKQVQGKWRLDRRGGIWFTPSWMIGSRFGDKKERQLRSYLLMAEFVIQFWPKAGPLCVFPPFWCASLKEAW